MQRSNVQYLIHLALFVALGMGRADALQTPTGSVVLPHTPASELWQELPTAVGFPGLQPAQGFGYRVDMDQGLLVVGSTSNCSSGTAVGTAHLFRRSALVWTYVTELEPPNPTDDFGYGNDVAVSGGTVIVAAVGARNSGVQTGAVYVWDFDNITSTWCPQRLAPPDPSGSSPREFGHDVDISGGTIVIGDIRGPASNFAGAVYLFERVPTGGSPCNDSWSPFPSIASPGTLAIGDRFGGGVTIDGDRFVAVSRYDSNTAAPASGIAFVFEKSGGAWPTAPTDALQPSDPVFFGNFGRDVDIEGDTILVGAHGRSSAYVFRPDPMTPGQWLQQQQLLPGGPMNQFGYSVVLEGSLAAIGAPADSGLGLSGAGAVYLYFLDSATQLWTPRSKLYARDPGANDQFGGYSLGLDGWTLSVGANCHDHFATDGGTVYVSSSRLRR